jgi:hypothetical protein
MALRPTQGNEIRLCPATVSLEALPSPLSSLPERTRISYLAELATTTDAALLGESRMTFINATILNRKSGERSGESSVPMLPLGNVFRRSVATCCLLVLIQTFWR